MFFNGRHYNNKDDYFSVGGESAMHFLDINY